MKKGLLVIFASFSGGGKSTIIRELKKKHPDWEFSISATTRSPRKGEDHGKHYYFVDRAEFQSMIEENKLLEYEEVHKNYYGTPSQPLEDALGKGRIYILDVDVKGAISIMKKYPDDHISLFIDIPDMATLEARLRARGSESEDSIALRLSRIPQERNEKEKFDCVIINDILEDVVLRTEQTILNKWRNE